jgi:hypothetical protein
MVVLLFFMDAVRTVASRVFELPADLCDRGFGGPCYKADMWIDRCEMVCQRLLMRVMHH